MHEKKARMIRAFVRLACAALVPVFVQGCASATSSGSAAAGVQGTTAIYHAGEYSGKAQGYGGIVTTTVTVSDFGITDVSVDDSAETVEIGQVAVDMMVEQILEVQSAEIDVVTGATITSDAVKKGLEEALGKAAR